MECNFTSTSLLLYMFAMHLTLDIDSRLLGWNDQIPPHQNGHGPCTGNRAPAPPSPQKTRPFLTEVTPPVSQQIATLQASPRSSNKRHYPLSPTTSSHPPSLSTPPVLSSSITSPSPQNSPHPKTMNRQNLTPAQRERMLAVITAACADPGATGDTAPAADTMAQPKANDSASLVKNTTPSRPQNANRIPAPDFSPAIKPAVAGTCTPAPPIVKLNPGTTSTTPAAARVAVARNPASEARRKAIEDAIRSGPPLSGPVHGGAAGVARGNVSPARAGTFTSMVDGGTQESVRRCYADDDHEIEPGRLGRRPLSNGVAGPSNGPDTGADNEVELTDDRFFTSPTVTQVQMMTPPRSTSKPRLKRKMVDEEQEEEEGDEDEDEGVEMDEDGGEDVKPMMGIELGASMGKGKERETRQRQRLSERMVRAAFEGLNWDKFEASVGYLYLSSPV